MAIKKVVEIDVDVVRANGGLENFTQNFKKSEEAAKSLKTQLREAQLEVATLSEKFGDTSREAVEAAKKAAILKDRIGDAKNLTEAFNPDAKFKALSGALTGVAGGFSVVTGLMGTLGTESKEVEGAILKVQSAMAIASGAQAVGESIDSFKQLGAVVKSFSLIQKITTAAQWLWNAAMAANPIGAIVAVVVALIAAGYALVKMFIASSEATKKAEAANKALNKELEKQVKSQKLATQEADLARESQLGMAKASGKSAAEVRKLAVELANQEVKQKLVNAQTLYAIALEAQRVAGLEDATDAEKETAKNALKAYNDSNEALKTSVLNRRKLIIQNRIAETQEATDARQKAAEEAKKANDDAIANQKKHNEELRKTEQDRLKNISNLEEDYLKDLQNLNAKSDQEKLDLQKQRELAEINSLTKTAQEKENLLRLFEEKYFTLQQELDDKNAETKRRKLEEETKLRIEKEDSEWQRYQELTLQKSDYDKLVLTQKYEAEYLAAEGNAALQTELKNKLEKDLADIDDKAKEEAKQKEQALLDAKLAFAQQGLSLVAEIAGKGSKIGKAVAVAQATISGIEGVQNAYSTAQKSPITIGFPAYPIVQASLAGVFAALQLRKILSTNVGGASSGSSVSGGGGGGSAPAPPQFNIVGQSSTNQLSQTIAGQQNRPIQTYVVGNQVSTQQSLDRNAVATSTFG
jgi:hypothetical protein